jgi:hypothetical protein
LPCLLSVLLLLDVVRYLHLRSARLLLLMAPCLRSVPLLHLSLVPRPRHSVPQRPRSARLLLLRRISVFWSTAQLRRLMHLQLGPPLLTSAASILLCWLSPNTCKVFVPESAQLPTCAYFIVVQSHLPGQVCALQNARSSFCAC